MSRPCVCRVYSLDVSAVIELCKTAFGGFTVALADVLSGFLHGSDDHVKADISGAAEEVGKVECVHCTFCGNGIALDAGNLHQAADGIARQPELMLHGNFCRVFRLPDGHSHQRTQGGGSHGAGGTDFCLTATFRS